MPVTPAVEHLNLEVTTAAFTKIVEQAVRSMGGRLPVEVELGTVRLVDGGAEIVAKVKRSILKAELRARIGISISDPSTIRIRIDELDAPAWVPVQFVLDHGVNYATSRPGFSRVSGDAKAIDVKPAEVVTAANVPVSFAQPGAWSVKPTAASLTAHFEAV